MSRDVEFHEVAVLRTLIDLNQGEQEEKRLLQKEKPQNDAYRMKIKSSMI